MDTVAIHTGRNIASVEKFIQLSEFSQEFQKMHSDGNIHGVFYNEDGEIVAEDIWQEIHKDILGASTFDIQFSDDEATNEKVFEISLEDAKAYIEQYNGTNESYFEDYKGGTVSVVNNSTGETVYEEEIR